jgi:hypothetical protein
MATGGSGAGGRGSGGAMATGGSGAGGRGSGGAMATGGSGAGGRGSGGATATGGSGAGGRGSGGAGGNGRVTCQNDGDCQLFKCCHNECVNTRNDIAHCGGCDRPCGGSNPFCSGDTCGEPPCSATCAGGTQCCANQCCPAGQLCCFMEVGPGFIGCATPVNGTCPQGCIGGCPCASPTTPIATPAGERPIAELRAGDLVYSVHRGAFAAVPIKLVHRTPVTTAHQVVELRLAHGPILKITPRHPTGDGRSFGDLDSGDRLDGVTVLDARLVPYREPFTYDILPDSDSGAYVAGGVLIGSSLAEPSGRAARLDPERPLVRSCLAPAGGAPR